MTESSDIEPYEILSLTKQATAKEIKRSYHKLCLKFHPDKSSDPEHTEQFNKVQLAYLVLSDEERKKHYDSTGVAVPYGPIGLSAGLDFSSGLFEEITKDLIEKDKREYQNSEEERTDILKEFIQLKGDFSRLFECIIHLEFSKDEESRIFQLCEDFIAKGEVDIKDIPKWTKYVDNRPANIKKLQRKADREAKQAQKAQLDSQKAEGSSLEELGALIMKNRGKQKDIFGDIFEKYSKPQPKKTAAKKKSSKVSKK